MFCAPREYSASYLVQDFQIHDFDVATQNKSDGL